MNTTNNIPQQIETLVAKDILDLCPNQKLIKYIGHIHEVSFEAQVKLLTTGIARCLEEADYINEQIKEMRVRIKKDGATGDVRAKQLGLDKEDFSAGRIAGKDAKKGVRKNLRSRKRL